MVLVALPHIVNGDKMKIAIAQMNSYPADINRNVQNTIKYIEKAKKQNANIIVFPEMTIPGYLSMDLFQNQNFIDANKKGLEEVIKHTNNITAIVGFADSEGKIGPGAVPIIYNSAAVIKNKKLLGIQDKTLLPQYDIFDERRYFSSSRGTKVFEINGEKIGVQICEDLWDSDYEEKVTSNLKSQGAKIIFNLSASPYYIGKVNLRKEQLKRHSGTKILYANTVGVHDGYDGQVIFDGRSMVIDLEGKIIAAGKKFEEDLLIIDFDKKNPEVILEEKQIADMYEALVFGVQEYFKQFNDKTKAFIGLSGGIDSALVGAIAKDALGSKRVKGIAMPSKYSSKSSLDDAKKLAENLGIEYSVISIKEGVKGFEKMLEKDFLGTKTDVTEENIQARIRGNILMAESNKFGGIVLSTGNKTEMALGYCTLYGDMSGGLSVIADADKLKVYEMAKYRNSISKVIPNSSIEKAPTAELAPGQSDEKGLGASYEILAPLVNEIIEDGKNKDELTSKYELKLVENTLRRVHGSEYKRRQAAPAFKVTKKSFGIGRRVPMNHNFF